MLTRFLPRVLLAAALWLAAGPAWAVTCGGLPFIFANGTTADATQVNSDFSLLLNCANVAAPLASPSFGGTVTMPDAATWGAAGLAHVVALGVNRALPAVGVVDVSGQYNVAGSQIAASNLSNGTTGTGAVVLATGSSAVAMTSPVLTTPALGNATGTTLALNGCTIGTNTLCTTGTANISSTLTANAIVTSGFSYSGTTGNLSIGNALSTSNTNVALCANGTGNISFSTGGTGCASSDGRLKTVVGSAPGLDAVMQLRPVMFDWKDSHRGGRSIGFIAQDVAPVIPELVSQGSDGYYSVAYMNLTAALTKAIQEQQGEIDRLTALVAKMRRSGYTQFGGDP